MRALKRVYFISKATAYTVTTQAHEGIETPHNSSKLSTSFTVTTQAREGIETRALSLPLLPLCHL